MSDFHEMLREHTEKEEVRFDSILSEIRFLRENHMSHMEDDIQALKIQGATVTADVNWVKWGILAILGSMIAGTIGLIFTK